MKTRAQHTTLKTKLTRINVGYLTGSFFANQYPVVLHETTYEIIRHILKKDDDTTNRGNGCVEIPLSSSRLPIFKHLLGKFGRSDDISIERIFVQETGEYKKGYKPYDYGPINEERMRILVNLRPPEQADAPRGVSKTVGIGVCIEHTRANIIARNTFAVALVSELANISILSSNTIPDSRFDCARSVFVVIDLLCGNTTRGQIADELLRQRPVKPEAIAEGIEKARPSFEKILSTLKECDTSAADPGHSQETNVEAGLDQEDSPSQEVGPVPEVE
jgi:hypothetical protein